ncbi:MAG TPA: hypothetical protein VHV83_15425, partial [Armatimonadota bacterium]|nr:hypothetical protein [Armatimonadota bacterium]
MLTVDEYITRRKNEDQLDEFNLNSRMENLKICINYLFEYFDYYLNTPEEEKRTVLHDEKLNQYRKQLHEYSPGIREWLVNIYAEHGKHLNRTIGNILKRTDLFLLYSSESEFRSIAYDCHAQLLAKHPFLKGQAESLFIFIKEYHQVQSSHNKESDSEFISYEINEWIEETWTQYHVHLAGFCREWVSRFWDDTDSWPLTHR